MILRINYKSCLSAGNWHLYTLSDHPGSVHNHTLCFRRELQGSKMMLRFNGFREVSATMNSERNGVNRASRAKLILGVTILATATYGQAAAKDMPE